MYIFEHNLHLCASKPVVTRKRILVVDDEESIRRSLELILQNTFEVLLAENGEEALKSFNQKIPDVVLLDVMMPKLDGLETLSRIRKNHGHIPVIMLTAAGEVKTAVEAMKNGALDYLSKPFDVEELTRIILSALSTSGISKEIIGESEEIRALKKRIDQVAQKDASVLITGESGTGKELIAREIHKKSKRASGPFIPLNCAAIPESLIESELFGHEKGAFTGAGETRIGFCELADGGTLFLDEIGELSQNVQVKLLRFLQEKEFFRVGRGKPVKVNVRIITATNRNLEELVRKGSFRQDLFYRINVVNIEVPPLRERHSDIQILIKHFCEKLSSQYGPRELVLSDEAKEALELYRWPGNVRELENVIESILATTDRNDIHISDLPRKLIDREEAPIALSSSVQLLEAEKQFETEMILKALKKSNNVQTKAAELLGISRRILKYKMDKLGITEMLKSS